MTIKYQKPITCWIRVGAGFNGAKVTPMMKEAENAPVLAEVPRAVILNEPCCGGVKVVVTVPELLVVPDEGFTDPPLTVHVTFKPRSGAPSNDAVKVNFALWFE